MIEIVASIDSYWQRKTQQNGLNAIVAFPSTTQRNKEEKKTTSDLITFSRPKDFRISLHLVMQIIVNHS